MYVKHTLISEAEMKILERFLDLKRHYFAELTKTANLTPPRALRALRKLTSTEILDAKTEANVKYYSIKKTPVAYTALGAVEYNITQQFLTGNKTIARGLEMLKEKYADYSVMLIFGSIVKGYATKTSDIDILLLKENISKADIQKMDNIVDMINGRTGLRISPHLMTIEEFKKRNSLAKEAIEKHFLIEGAELFYKLALA